MSNSGFEVEQVDMLGARASRDKELGTEFPQRAEINTDLNYYDRAKRIDTKINFRNPSSILYEVKKTLYEKDIDHLVRSGNYLASMKAKLQRNANRRQNCVKMLAFSFNENTKVTDALNERLILASEGFDVSSIYDSYDLTPSELKQRIKTSIGFMAEYGITPKRINVRIPKMLQRPDILKEKMAVSFADTDGVALKYTSIGRSPRQHRVVRQFNATGGWTHMYDVPNMWSGNSRTSTMHMEQLFGIDSFSLRVRKPLKNPPPLTPKRLDIGTLGNLTIQEHTQRYGTELLCPCDICMNRTMTDMENDYSPFERYTMFRSHLPYAANIEYALDRDAIENGGKHLLNRLRNKEFMAQPFKAIYNEDINSRNFQPRLF